MVNRHAGPSRKSVTGDPWPVDKRYGPTDRYDDGTSGEVDLSDLGGRGVFTAWEDRAFFDAVRLRGHGAVEWGAGIDLCPDAMCLRLTGKSPEEVFPVLGSIQADA